jgi:hypothetical protein
LLFEQRDARQFPVRRGALGDRGRRHQESMTQAAEGYRTMEERRAIKTLLRP